MHIHLFSLVLLLISSSYSLTLNSKPQVAIVGGGVGGLVSSALLSRSGLDVLLVEKNERCGGRMNSEYLFVKENQHSSASQYRFDVGPSLLLLPDIYKKTFEILGTNIEDHVELLKVEPFYRVYFEEDGTFAEISSNEEKMKAITNEIEANSYEKFIDYLKTAGDFLRFGLPTVIEEKPDFTHFGSFLSASIKIFPLRSHDSMLRHYFKTDKMRAMMSFQDLYIGLSPYESPAIFSLLQALELERGIYYPKGGFQKVAQALTSIAEKSGVSLINNCTVEGIHVSQEERMDSIDVSLSTDGSRTQHNIAADTFIANIDAPHFESMLVPKAEKDQRTTEGVPSCGIVQIQLALNTSIESLSHHTLYLSKSYKNSWKVVDKPDSAAFNPREFNFYVHAPSRTDPSACPPGHDAITILVPVPPLPKANEGHYLDISIVRQAVIDRLQEMEYASSNLTPRNPICIADHIVSEQIREPEKWQEEFGLFRGSAFGLAHSIDQLNVLRPRLRHPVIKNLFRAGASTRPGNGVPLVMIGARLTSEAILRDLGMKSDLMDKEYVSLTNDLIKEHVGLENDLIGNKKKTKVDN
mmetsp:Transcript_16493/g.15815  ORF Transcript_16493/g.15815 Transcript_16493/m.15815 type:complete len:582 (+) Transcript_16493:95-1840(+)